MDNKRLLFILSLIIACITFDQVTKDIAQKMLKYTPTQKYLWDFFRLQYAENAGAMLGLGSNLPEGLRFWLLTVFVGIMLIILLFYLLWNQGQATTQTVALSLIAGGGISNFIDRMVNNGWVVDFMNIGIGWLRSGIFNFADVMIMIGLGIILLYGKWHGKESVEELASEEKEKVKRKK